MNPFPKSHLRVLAVGRGLDLGGLVKFGNRQQALAAPVKNAVDKFQLLPEFLKVRGLVKTALGLPSITLYKDVRIGEPSVIIDGVTEKLIPQMPALRHTYAAPIYVNIEYITGSHGSKTTQMKRDVIIGRMPIMLRSYCCILYGKDEEELARYGECPLDPGGYFVIKGTEKAPSLLAKVVGFVVKIVNDCYCAITAQSTLLFLAFEISKYERLMLVLIPVLHVVNMFCPPYLFPGDFDSGNNFRRTDNHDTDKKGCVQHLLQAVPIMVVLKAMGMESDQEVVPMIEEDPRYSELLLPSIEDCVKEAVHTQHQALEFLEQKVKKLPYSTPADKEGRALGILRDIFLANIPRTKSRSSWGRYCLLLIPKLATFLKLEGLFKTMNDEARKTIDTILAKPSRSSRFDISQVCPDV
ncbi:UNVERIFIED_CONTAM: DNA-directed RNA polymerase III subunit [Sesamum calycinum]|uniref:DNA-directed RNA polymerase n=1 Tax=Sesamum calycinum TaxID=2727403 RepID=A0AAW2SZ30_9LAMI